jgi:hypothetical protein
MKMEDEFKLQVYEIHTPPKILPIRYTLSPWGLFVDMVNEKAWFEHRRTGIRVPYTQKRIKKVIFLLYGYLKIVMYRLKRVLLCLKNGKI